MLVIGEGEGKFLSIFPMPILCLTLHPLPPASEAIIQDSSDSNQIFYDFMLGVKVGAHSILKTCNSHYQMVPIVLFPSTSLITVSNHRDPINSLQYLYFTCFFDIVGCQHLPTQIMTPELHQFKFPFASHLKSFCA